MAKRKKQLNKNLVAVLVSTAMVLTVAVVAVVTANAARRDPAQIAERAKGREDAGNFREAFDLYRRAFRVDKETRYLVDASRCAYELGEVGLAISALNQAHSQDPEDTVVITALLDRYWENRTRMPVSAWENVRDLAEKLLVLEKDNLLALVSRAKALEALRQRNPDFAAEAKEALAQAVAIDALDPRVVEVKVSEMFVDARQRREDLIKDGDAQQAEEMLAGVRSEVAKLFDEAIAKHPGSAPLYINAAQVFIDDGSAVTTNIGRLQAQIDEARRKNSESFNFEAADARLAEMAEERDQAYATAEKLLADGRAALPDHERLLFAIATYHRLRADQTFRDGDLDTCRRHVTEGLAAVQRTLEIEPAEYDAYTCQANLAEKQAELDGSLENDRLAVQVGLLETLEAGLVDTVGQRTIRAVTNKEGRARMLASAFDRAYAYYRDATDETAKARYETFLKDFRTRAQEEFQDSVLVQLLDGQYFILTGDTRAAIQAFSLAEDKAKDIMPRYELLAKEQLARLYTYQEENGVALKYTNAALQLYGGAAPMDLWLNRATLLIRLKRPKEALDQCDLLLEQRPGHAGVLRIKAAALHALERSDEAEAALAQLEGSSIDLMKARIAVTRAANAEGPAKEAELQKAEQIVLKIVQDDPDNTAAMTLALQIMVQAERHDEALALVEAAQAATTDDSTRRVLEAQKIVLQTKDPEEREKRLFEVIDQIDDPLQRAAEYFNYHYQRDNYAKAAEYANELETLKPEDAQVYGIQFELALRLEQELPEEERTYERAQQYVSRLAELNADRAGGATYRGMLKRIQGDLPGAIEEMRAAERALPTDSNLKIQVAEALWKLNEYDATIEKLKEAVDLDPSNFLANKLLYRAYEQLGRDDPDDVAVTQYLLRAAALNPNDPYIKQKQQRLLEAKNPVEGIRSRIAMREEDPEDLDNIIRLGRLYMGIRDLPAAEECLQAARKLAPDERRMAEFASDYYYATRDMETGGEVLKAYVDAKDKLTKINAQLLLAEFYERFDAHEQVEAAFAAGLEIVDELRETRAERWRRGKLQVLAATAAYYERTERYEDAITKLQESLTLHPEDDERFLSDRQVAETKIIQNLMKLNRLAEAEEKIEAFRTAYPDDVRWLNAKGELASRRNEPAEVRRLMTLSLDKNPNDPWAYWTRGRANLALRNFNEARQDLLKVKELSPRGFNLSHRVQLARLYMTLEQFELAETELRDLVAEKKGDQRMALMLIGLLRNTGQDQRAQEFVNDLITRFPKNPFWPATLGQILVQREEYSAAIRPFRKAVELTDGRNPQIISEWLQAMLKAERTSELLKAFDELDPEIVTPFMVVIAAEGNQQRNNETEMRRLTERALREAAEINAPLLGFVASRAARLVGAPGVEEILARAASDMDSDGGQRIRWYLARGRIMGNDPERRAAGVAEIDKLIEETTPGTVLHQEVLLTKAFSLENSENYEEAINVYERVLESNPRHWQSLNNAAYLLTELGRGAQAIKYAEQAREMQPQNANVLDTLGWAYYRADEATRAEAVLLEAVSNDPRNLAVLAHLGKLYRETERDVEARRYYERVVRVGTELKLRETSYFQEAEQALEELK